MAFRLLLLVIGLVELLAPKQMVDFWMGLASKDDDVELRPWVYSVARLEGAVIVLWLLKRRRGRGKAE
ncbi:hypothetical protein KTS45_08010 [Halomicroarcula limicola]|uniref:Uncharacterized protein n=1 Tax=Haloarcula limicola TaxID=1429915 RepID=A0A8J8C4I4_9EURY|nr:hypothetical protein [Halomicroarcula limicola]MBV0924149.1 hypothetical protein [Halomicroarcula limicola]